MAKRNNSVERLIAGLFGDPVLEDGVPLQVKENPESPVKDLVNAFGGRSSYSLPALTKNMPSECVRTVDGISVYLVGGRQCAEYDGSVLQITLSMGVDVRSNAFLAAQQRTKQICARLIGEGAMQVWPEAFDRVGYRYVNVIHPYPLRIDVAGKRLLSVNYEAIYKNLIGRRDLTSLFRDIAMCRKHRIPLESPLADVLKRKIVAKIAPGIYESPLQKLRWITQSFAVLEDGELTKEGKSRLEAILMSVARLSRTKTSRGRGEKVSDIDRFNIAKLVLSLAEKEDLSERFQFEIGEIAVMLRLSGSQNFVSKRIRPFYRTNRFPFVRHPDLKRGVSAI